MFFFENINFKILLLWFWILIKNISEPAVSGCMIYGVSRLGGQSKKQLEQKKNINKWKTNMKKKKKNKKENKSQQDTKKEQQWEKQRKNKDNKGGTNNNQCFFCVSNAGRRPATFSQTHVFCLFRFSLGFRV